MIPRLIRWCFDKPLVPVVVAAVGTLLGVVTFGELRRDVFPDLSVPVFNVIVQNAAMSPEELESAVVVPLEAQLAGLPHVRRIRSSSQLGVAQMTVEFEPEADYFDSRQFVTERVGQITPMLPEGTEPPFVSSLTGRLNEIFEFTLESEPGTVDLMTLRDLAELEVRNRLLAVPGVAGVEMLGGYLRQFEVQLDPYRMAARGVSLDEVLHAVEGSNQNASAGFVVQGPMEWTVRAAGRAADAIELRQTVVAVRSETPVLLGDVAEVRESPAVRRGLAHRLRGEVVSARVAKQLDADTVKVAARIRAAIEDLRRGLPKGVELRVVYDQSELVDSALGGVGRAVLIGAVFVVMVLFAMLGDWRAALLVTLVIPTSLAFASVLLWWAGIGLNTMTLGGLAIAVGLLVDAAIIMTENVLHRIKTEPHRSPRECALDAALEVGRPIAFATLIVLAVFAPLFGIGGLEGRMYQPLAAAVVATLSASLWLALTVVPVAAGLLLRSNPDAPEDVPLIAAMKRGYAPLLDACMRRAGAVRIATLAITIPALGLAAVIGRDLMPQLDEGAVLIQTSLPAEASLGEVDRLNHRAEDALREMPEVEEVVRRTGRSEETQDPMPHTLSDVLVVLKPDARRSREDLEAEMRERLAKVAALSVFFTTPLGMRIDESIGGTPADLNVRIYGPELPELARLAERARGIVAGIDGLTDLRVEQVSGLPQLKVSIDRAAVARVGLTPGDVVRAVRVALVGEEGPPMWIGQRRFDLIVRFDEPHRSDPEAIRSLPVEAHDGTRIPLSRLARIEEVFGPAAIRREAGSRRAAVEAQVVGRDLAGAAEEVRRTLAANLELPPRYFLDVGGRVETQGRAMRSLLIAIGLAVLAVFLLLYLALGSLAETLVILATLPDAMVGGVAALLIAGETWNVSSLVGVIGLFGIAVQNGLVLVAQTRALVARGRPFDAALREASIGRVRPKLMTAATAILALLPLLVLPLDGTEIERPLALVMVGGLITSTLFTLLALPTFYVFVQRRRSPRAPA